MRKSLLLITFAAFAAVFFIACQPPEQTSDETATEESMEASLEDTVQGIGDEITAAWNAGDAEGYASLYAADGDFSGPDGEILTGREQIAAHYAELFEGIYAGTTITISTTSIRELEPGVVLVNGSFEISGMAVAEGGEMPPARGLYTRILTRDGDGWHIASLRAWVPVKAPGTT